MPRNVQDISDPRERDYTILINISVFAVLTFIFAFLTLGFASLSWVVPQSISGLFSIIGLVVFCCGAFWIPAFFLEKNLGVNLVRNVFFTLLVIGISIYVLKNYYRPQLEELGYIEGLGLGKLVLLHSVSFSVLYTFLISISYFIAKLLKWK